VNAKMEKKKSCIAQRNCNILDVEDYHWAMFTHAMEFFQECASLKKLIPKHFFISLLQDLLIKDLVSLGNLLSTKFMKPNRQFYVTPSRQTWVPQDLKNKMLKLVNC